MEGETCTAARMVDNIPKLCVCFPGSAASRCGPYLLEPLSPIHHAKSPVAKKGTATLSFVPGYWGRSLHPIRDRRCRGKAVAEKPIAAAYITLRIRIPSAAPNAAAAHATSLDPTASFKADRRRLRFLRAGTYVRRFCALSRLRRQLAADGAASYRMDASIPDLQVPGARLRCASGVSSASRTFFDTSRAAHGLLRCRF